MDSHSTDETGIPMTDTGGAGDAKTLVLVVEDSRTQAAKLQSMLEANDYAPHVASDGEEALAWLSDNRPTLILSDVVMPGLDGYGLCRRVKGNPETKDIPVVLLTTLSEPGDVIEGLACGADNFMTKPFDEGQLLSRLEYILLNKKLRTGSRSAVGLEVAFAGQKYFLSPERFQILDMLFSSFETAVRMNRELKEANRQLRDALGAVRTLKELLPMCCHCKKVRDDEGYWQQVEDYVRTHADSPCD